MMPDSHVPCFCENWDIAVFMTYITQVLSSEKNCSKIFALASEIIIEMKLISFKLNKGSTFHAA